MTATPIPLFDDPPGEEPARRPVRAMPRAPEPEVLLTAAEVADVLKIGRSKLYELIARGSLTSVKVDRSRRFRRSDVDLFIRSLGAEPCG
jgi:excisionase family DNA binding protein